MLAYNRMGIFSRLRTYIHNQRMPDGRGVLLPCKAKKRRQYFVYCKIFQRSRPAKDPLRRYRMVVNMGSLGGQPELSALCYPFLSTGGYFLCFN